MKLVNPSFEIRRQGDGILETLKAIEWAGRTAYKSEDKIDEKSSLAFVKKLKQLHHLSPLEFGTMWFKIPTEDTNAIKFFQENPWSRIKISNSFAWCTTSYRVLVENRKMSLYFQYKDPDASTHLDLYNNRIAVKIVLPRVIADEFMRHRTFSFLTESTRYCDYSKNKFQNEITFVVPYWMRQEVPPCKVHGFDLRENNEITMKYISARGDMSEKTISMEAYIYLDQMENCEIAYLDLKEQKLPTQFARDVLPMSIKTEMCMCGFADDWEHFFKMRSSLCGATGVHPDANYIANALYEEFVHRNLIPIIQENEYGKNVQEE